MSKIDVPVVMIEKTVVSSVVIVGRIFSSCILRGVFDRCILGGIYCGFILGNCS